MIVRFRCGTTHGRDAVVANPPLLSHPPSTPQTIMARLGSARHKRQRWCNAGEREKKGSQQGASSSEKGAPLAHPLCSVAANKTQLAPLKLDGWKGAGGWEEGGEAFPVLLLAATLAKLHPPKTRLRYHLASQYPPKIKKRFKGSN